MDVCSCPFRDEAPEAGASDYRGPYLPVNRAQIGDPIAADKPGNHGEEEGGNVLRNSGDVQGVGRSDPLWRLCEILLRP